MANAQGKDEFEYPTFSGGMKSLVARTAYSDFSRHVAADIGSTFQACLWAGWHTQSASIDAPEHISEELAKQEQNKKLEPEKEAPTVGLEKE